MSSCCDWLGVYIALFETKLTSLCQVSPSGPSSFTRQQKYKDEGSR